MIDKNTKKILSFNDFLSSLAEEPLGIKYKYIARILYISESTLSKLRHQKLNKIPESLYPDTIGTGFSEGIVNFFSPSESTVKRFSIYARKIFENYFCSESLRKSAFHLTQIKAVDTECAKNLCDVDIPKFLKSCYEEAYSNSTFNYNKSISSRNDIQSEIIFKKICDIIDRDTFDNEKLRKLLNVVYAANIRHQINNFILSSGTLLDITGRFLKNQSHEPFYNWCYRTEVISITPDNKKILRSIKGRQQIVFQSVKTQEYAVLHSLNYFVDMPSDKIIKNSFAKFECTVNRIPLVKYINMHEKSNYTDISQFLCAKQVKNNISGTVETEISFRFNLYPNVVGETADIVYEYCYISPFIPNISCNFNFSLLYPCKFLEHEFTLDSKTKTKWGIQVNLFTPITTSVCTTENSDKLIVQSGGTADLKRITFYDWALPGTGYYSNLYELKYKDEQM